MSSWMDKIPDGTLCGYFYVFFVIYSVIAALSIIGGIWTFSASKLPAGFLFAVLFGKFLSFVISATAALFLYLICERALKPAMKAHHAENGHGENGHGVAHGANPVGHMAQSGF